MPKHQAETKNGGKKKRDKFRPKPGRNRTEFRPKARPKAIPASRLASRLAGEPTSRPNLGRNLGRKPGCRQPACQRADNLGRKPGCRYQAENQAESCCLPGRKPGRKVSKINEREQNKTKTLRFQPGDQAERQPVSAYIFAFQPGTRPKYSLKPESCIRSMCKTH